MFLKGKKHSSHLPKQDRADVLTGTSPGASTNTAAPSRKQASGVPSIVSADLTIEGNLHSIGDLQIDGIVNGDIMSKTLTVGEGAEVHGAIEAESLRVCGTVEGEVTAKSVVLTKTARVYGDVLHESLSVEAGALIHGYCKRVDAPPPRAAAEAPGAMETVKSAAEPRDTSAIEAPDRVPAASPGE